MGQIWESPQGFEEIQSRMAGISVFAPIKESPNHAQTVTFTCPNCGAVTQFDVSAGGVTCENCGYSKSTQTETVGRSAPEQEFKLDTIQQAKSIQWTNNRRNLVCEQCGAITSIPETAISGQCAFCASNKVHIAELPTPEFQPKLIIPFQVEPERLKQIAKKWLGVGWYHPKDLSQTASVDRFNGVYMPYWTFDADVNADWKALVGYERTERYYDASSKEWKTRTTIDWRWEQGRVNRQFDDYLIPGTQKVSRRILDQIQPFDLNELRTFTPDYLAGWQANHFDLPLEKAWDTAKDSMRETSREACYADIPTSHVRNFSMSADFANETWRYIFLPVFLSTYRFNEKIYQIMVNGQTGEIAGQKPVEWWKIWAAIAASLAPGFLLLLIGLPLLLAGGIGILPLILGFIFLILGIIFSVSLYRKAVASEAP